jgi:hypothetical protein
MKSLNKRRQNYYPKCKRSSFEQNLLNGIRNGSVFYFSIESILVDYTPNFNFPRKIGYFVGYKTKKAPNKPLIFNDLSGALCTSGRSRTLIYLI